MTAGKSIARQSHHRHPHPDRLAGADASRIRNGIECHIDPGIGREVIPVVGVPEKINPVRGHSMHRQQAAHPGDNGGIGQPLVFEHETSLRDKGGETAP